MKDLNEKLDTIKAKRQEDRNKLKEFEKMKIMFEQVFLYGIVYCHPGFSYCL